MTSSGSTPELASALREQYPHIVAGPNGPDGFPDEAKCISGYLVPDLDFLVAAAERLEHLEAAVNDGIQRLEQLGAYYDASCVRALVHTEGTHASS